MRSTLASLLASLVAAAAWTGTAAAEPSVTAAAAPAHPIDLGFRVGGYGFRRADATSQASSWDDCRMNGIGVFADRPIAGPVFAEAGLDTYFSAGQPAADELPIDRENVLLSAAIGARTNLASWLGVYAQLGAGAEFARVSVPYGDARIAANKVLPDGFIGIGADLRIAAHTYIGANLRTHVMGNFDYDPARLKMTNAWVAAPPASDVFAATPALSAQAQFFLRHTL